MQATDVTRDEEVGGGLGRVGTRREPWNRLESVPLCTHFLMYGTVDIVVTGVCIIWKRNRIRAIGKKLYWLETLLHVIQGHEAPLRTHESESTLMPLYVRSDLNINGYIEKTWVLVHA